MSDTWYRDPPGLPPFEDGFGRLWAVDGRCLNPDPDEGKLPPEFAWLADWPEDLRWTALQAAANMQLREEYNRLVNEMLDQEFGQGMRDP